MTYEGIEAVIRAGLGRNEWAATIHFPDASEPLARSSVVKLERATRQLRRPTNGSKGGLRGSSGRRAPLANVSRGAGDD